MTTTTWSGARRLATALPLLGWRFVPRGPRYRPRVTSAGELAHVLEELRERHHQPALAAAVIHGDTSIHAVAGTLVAGAPEPALPHHRFHIGSTTKSVTALVLAQLAEAGTLDPDRPLGEVLPGIAMHPAYARVSLHDLMLSRAGVIAYQRTDAEPADVIEVLDREVPRATPYPREQRRRIAAYALARPPLFPPGTRSVYSNVGWAILGHALEVAAGAPYEQLVAERVFAPLGMTTARLGGWPASTAEPDQPRGHYVEPTGPRAQPLDDAYVLAPWMNPAGGIHCSIADYAAYAREVLHGLHGRGRLLARAGHARIHTAHARERQAVMYPGARGKTALTLGYGWVVVALPGGATLSAGDGSAGTFYARIAIVPELDLAFVGLASAGDGARALDAVIRRCTGLPWR